MNDENKFVFTISCHAPIVIESIKEDQIIPCIKDKIITMRHEMINEAILKSIQEIGKRDGINSLIVVDEDKLMDIVHKAELLDLIVSNPLEIGCARRYPDNMPMMALFAQSGKFRIIEKPISEELFHFLEKYQFERMGK